MHLNHAYTWFKTLHVPKYAERIEQLARDQGMTLSEVPLEDGEVDP